MFFFFLVSLITIRPLLLRCDGGKNCIFTYKAFTKVTRINSTDYEIKLVDTAGQDEYSIFPTQYSMDFHGYVLVYSITSQKSFEVIQIIHEKLLDVMAKTQ